jgi:tRNA(Arg) A34 adenosine deaminase TadA
MEPERLMRLAMDKAREGIQRGQSPFGCAIARDGKLLACCHNTVRATPDTTAHAEVNAIRAACLAIGDVHLRGAVVATTCEPCAMCMAALHWAQVAHVYYGATIADAQQAGFNELQLPARDLLRLGGSSVQLSDGLLPDECRELFQLWLRRPDRYSY